VGEFNNWDQSRNLMKKSITGKFSLTLELEKNREYEFRYLVDETNWETDWDADSVASIPWSDEFNSVVKV
jgi:1,4-alpha-glucan branching enzyme